MFFFSSEYSQFSEIVQQISWSEKAVHRQTNTQTTHTHAHVYKRIDDIERIRVNGMVLNVWMYAYGVRGVRVSEWMSECINEWIVAMCQNHNNAKKDNSEKREALVRYNEHDDTITQKRMAFLLKKERRKHNLKFLRKKCDDEEERNK